MLVPGLRIIPKIYRWRIDLRFYKWYRALLALEQDMAANLTPGKREELLGQLDAVENAVNKMKVPASFADQFYQLRGHISFVRASLTESTQAR